VISLNEKLLVQILNYLYQHFQKRNNPLDNLQQKREVFSFEKTEVCTTAGHSSIVVQTNKFGDFKIRYFSLIKNSKNKELECIHYLSNKTLEYACTG